jgi:hypothetical protein
MLNLLRTQSVGRKCDGSSRREFLQVGTLGLLGLTLPDLIRARARASTGETSRKPPAIILLFLDGGASQFETFDPKMSAPQEYRCLFGETQTSLPGITFCSLLPNMARHANRMSVVRTLTHTDNDHGGATHWVKTGKPWPPEFLGKAAVIPQQEPSVGSMIARHFGPINRQTGVPTYVRVLSNHGGYPGDNGVWLGQDYDPFRVSATTTGRANPMLANMNLRIGEDRLADRRSLLEAIDQVDRSIDVTRTMDGMDAFRQQAYSVILGRAREAFDLSREPDRVRDRYGPGLGQELLLARRLCEAGAGFVTLNNGYWDHHSGIIPGCRDLCPKLDHAVNAYIQDVTDRGLVDDILLIVTGEFGRTPRVGGYGNGNAGRDHWCGTGPIAFFGGGLKMGQMIGETDARGAYPRTRPVSPADFAATIFQVLGMDLGLQYPHPSGRPTYMIEEGRPIEELF